MRAASLAAVLIVAAAVSSCRKQPDLEALRGEILELHKSFIQAHLDKDAAYIARFTSPDYISVSEGRVERINASEMEKMLKAYLDSTVFTAYEDAAEPIIGVSGDGSMAWTVVQVRVAGKESLADGSSHSYDVIWAWMTLYRREGTGWMRIADVSTNRPFNRGP